MSMKKIAFLILAAAVSFVSCNKNEVDESPVIVIEEYDSIVEIDHTKQDVIIDISSNISYDYAVTYPGTGAAANWLKDRTPGATKAMSTSSLEFEADSWEGAIVRDAVITISNKDNAQTRKVLVRQGTPKPSILVEFLDADVEQYTDSETGYVHVYVSEFGTDDRYGEQPLRAYVTTNNNFDVIIDESAQDWVKQVSSPSVSPVIFRVEPARTGDMYDYSKVRVAGVTIMTADKAAEQRMVIHQRPRTPGLYAVSQEGTLGELMQTEHKGAANVTDSVRIIGMSGEKAPLNNADLLAIRTYFPNFKVLDLSEAVFDTVPANAFYDSSRDLPINVIILPETGIKVIEDFAFKSKGNTSTLVTHIGPLSAIVKHEGGNPVKDIDGNYELDIPQTYIPDGVVYIGKSAFDSHTNVEKITIPRSVAIIKSQAFNSQKASSIVFKEAEQNTITEPVSFEGDESPRTTMVIEERAFYGSIASGRACRYQSDLFIPNYVSEIGKEAFRGLHNTAIADPYVATFKLTIGNNVTSIGIGAFIGGYCFNEIDFGNESSPELNIDGGTSSANGAFYNCSNVKSLKLPRRLRKIGGYSFYQCRFENLYFPEGATIIEVRAFGGGGATETYRIPNGRMRIPSTVTEIGSDIMTFWLPTNFNNPSANTIDLYLPGTDQADFESRVNVNTNAWRYATASPFYYNLTNTPTLNVIYYTPGGVNDPGI